MNTPDNEYDDDEYISRTAVKNEMKALQKLGEAIVKLTPGQLANIPLEGNLADAVATARRIKHREGLRRQMQYIGKLMRKEDISDIEVAYKKLQEGKKEHAQTFHQLEQWRDELIEKGQSAIEDVLEKHPSADRQYIRQLIMQANKEKKLNKPPSSSRKLFRYLRELAES